MTRIFHRIRVYWRVWRNHGAAKIYHSQWIKWVITG